MGVSVIGHKAKLNARQVALLQRIADGVEPVTSRESALAISVYALRSRGLVATTRTGGGSWVAAITDAGRFYLEHGGYPETVAKPSRPRAAAHRTSVPGAEASSPVLDPADLIARMQAAGGTLTVADPDAATRSFWRASIQTAIGAGHRLHYTGRLRGDIVVTTFASDTPEPARNARSRVRKANRVPVGPLPRKRTHPLVAELRVLAAATGDQDRAGVRVDARLPRVSRAALPRALRILQLLFTEAEQRGHAVRPADSGDRRRARGFLLVVLGHAYPVSVIEYRDLLTVKLDGVFSGRRFWSDGARVRLEHKIGDVLACLEVRAGQAEQRRHERERHAREHAETRQAETARYQAAFARDYATGVLREQVAAWRLAGEIRALCADVHERIADGQAPAGNGAWLAWARGHADLLDPTTGLLAVPHAPQASPEQLARYRDNDLSPCIGD